MHEDGRVPRSDRLGNLGEDRRRGFLECDGSAEDLADSVKEIYLLVTLGELERGVLDFLRAAKNLSDEWEQKPEVRLRRLARAAEGDGELGALDPGDLGDEHRAVVCPERGSTIPGRDVIRCRQARCGAGNEAQRLQVPLRGAPDGSVALRDIAECNEYRLELFHSRRSVSRTTLPLSWMCSTRSINRCIRKSPRPSSRMTFSGVVGSIHSATMSKSGP